METNSNEAKIRLCTSWLFSHFQLSRLVPVFVLVRSYRLFSLTISFSFGIGRRKWHCCIGEVCHCESACSRYIALSCCTWMFSYWRRINLCVAPPPVCWWPMAVNPYLNLCMYCICKYAFVCVNVIIIHSLYAKSCNYTKVNSAQKTYKYIHGQTLLLYRAVNIIFWQNWQNYTWRRHAPTYNEQKCPCAVVWIGSMSAKQVTGCVTWFSSESLLCETV